MLSKEERSIRAKNAALARWDSSLPQTSHFNELKIGNHTIPCAVLKLPNGEVIRLLTQRGMLKSLGRNPRGLKDKSGERDLPVFVNADNLKPFITDDLRGATEIIEFRLPTGQKAYGYRAELLPLICNVYLDAERAGKLLPQQKKIADACHLLNKSFSIIGIISLVDEVCGFQKLRDSDALQKILEKYLNKDLAKWVKIFPTEFYQQVYRLRNWAWNSSSKYRYPVVGKYTIDLVYERLLPGLLIQMKENMKALLDDGKPIGRYHQLLTIDNGIPKLKEHFSALLAVMKLSKNWNEMISNVNLVIPKVTNFELYMENDE